MDGEVKMDPEKVQAAEENWAAFADGVLNDLGIQAIVVDGDYDHLRVEVGPDTFSSIVQYGTLTLSAVRFSPGGGGTLEASAIHGEGDDSTDVTVIAKVSPPPLGGTLIKVGP